MDNISQLNVLLYDKKIGSLHLLPGERILFVFEPEYIENINRPILSLSFKDTFGDLITEFRPTRGRLPTFFSNLLPEGPLREYLARRAGVNASREFFLIKALGDDLPGAIRVVSETTANKVIDDFEVPSKQTDQTMHFSLAGVQLKFSAIIEASGGLTIPAHGSGGSWIIKLPSFRFKNVPENEYAMMMIAKKMGMDIPELKLVPINKISGLPNDVESVTQHVLAVKRFDRSQNGSIHIEDFAQVFGVYPEDKYKRASYTNIVQVLLQESGEEDVVELIQRLVFNVLIGNADMHVKNISLIYSDVRKAELAPGYDFVSTIAYIPDENMALKLVKSKRMRDLTKEQLEYFAVKTGLPKKLIIDVAKGTVERFNEVWSKEKKHLPINLHTIQMIEKHVKTIPLYSEI
ncbi:MAG: HipA domain-containing protein [bacterium]|nr:HipA domain-containing protein [bacterium]MBU1917565.1 HipA domain-containing protein [bacterium]